MAYMSQDHKKEIAARLKTIVPKSWKYTLSVDNHSTIVFNLKSAPIDLCAMVHRLSNERNSHRPDFIVRDVPKDIQVNPYYLDTQFEGEALEIMTKIKEAMNVGNYDNSDAMSDYFDRGFYLDINIGKWNQPFEVK